MLLGGVGFPAVRRATCQSVVLTARVNLNREIHCVMELAAPSVTKLKKGTFQRIPKFALKDDLEDVYFRAFNIVHCFSVLRLSHWCSNNSQG